MSFDLKRNTDARSDHCLFAVIVIGVYSAARALKQVFALEGGMLLTVWKSVLPHVQTVRGCGLKCSRRSCIFNRFDLSIYNPYTKMQHAVESNLVTRID